MICPIPTISGFEAMIGESAPMRRLFQLIDKVAPTDATVLISGESGTGKELVAEALHHRGSRRKEPFVALNCGAIPESLIDSELFGHEKGSFTGAQRTRAGVFERANGGTLFLDEITEMHADLQVRLLRVLETNEVRRVGGDEDIPVDVRVIAATNRDAREAVARGKLREDLLYRLSVFPIRVPPLIERDGDIERLACFFLNQLNDRSGRSKKLSLEALRFIKAFRWPGNVRQLKHAIHQGFIVASEMIEPHCLPDHVRPIDAISPPIDDPPTLANNPAGSIPLPMPLTPIHGRDELQMSVGMSIAEAERRLIDATLRHYDGNKKQAAEVLGVSLRTLYNRLNLYNLEGAGQPLPAELVA